MKVIVCLKQVPDTEANIRISSNSKSIDESGIKFIVQEELAKQTQLSDIFSQRLIQKIDVFILVLNKETK